MNKISSTVFEKKRKNTKKNNFYKLKKLKKEKSKRKDYFGEIRAKKVHSKMTSTKKGHNKTGRDKVVTPKRRASFLEGLEL